MSYRILLADDQQSLSIALRLMLEDTHGMCLVGAARDAEALLAEIDALQPDLILLDWELPGFQADVLATVRAHAPAVRVIALSSWPEALPDALAAGADAFVSKGDPPERLLDAIMRFFRAARAAE